MQKFYRSLHRFARLATRNSGESLYFRLVLSEVLPALFVSIHMFLQNSFFFSSEEILFVPFIILFSSMNLAPFSYMFTFISPSVCHSLLNILSIFLSDNVPGNFNWSGGLHIIPTVASFVFR